MAKVAGDLGSLAKEKTAGFIIPVQITIRLSSENALGFADERKEGELSVKKNKGNMQVLRQKVHPKTHGEAHIIL